MSYAYNILSFLHKSDPFNIIYTHNMMKKAPEILNTKNISDFKDIFTVAFKGIQII